MSDIAIKIENLKKQYHLGAIGGRTLNAELQSWWARKRGKEDPNLQIGKSAHAANETFWALKGINLEIKKGEAIGIIGANGAGKSTLLKILSRVTAPTEGDIWIDGRVSSMLEVGTGFHGELTGRENIYMNGAILGMTKKEVDQKMEDIIEFSECRQFIDTPVKRYSSGMYVKLAFAVAAHLDAEIMIMDEVLAVGDIKFQQKCLGKMGDASQSEGKTVLYVSHNMNTIRQLCNRCIVLNSGSLLYDGNVNDAIEAYTGELNEKLLGHYELKNVDRPTDMLGSALRITQLRFLDRPIYQEHSCMKLEIEFECFKNISNIRFYFPVRTLDDLPACLIESGPICNAREGEMKRVLLEIELGDMVEGKYYFFPTAFLLSEYTGHESLDQAREKIFFQIENKSEERRLTFNRAFWGDFRLANVRVIEEKNVEK